MKIQDNTYSTLDDMENDLLLMISNARKYNDPKSQIYKVRLNRRGERRDFYTHGYYPYETSTASYIFRRFCLINIRLA